MLFWGKNLVKEKTKISKHVSLRADTKSSLQKGNPRLFLNFWQGLFSFFVTNPVLNTLSHFKLFLTFWAVLRLAKNSYDFLRLLTAIKVTLTQNGTKQFLYCQRIFKTRFVKKNEKNLVKKCPTSWKYGYIISGKNAYSKVPLPRTDARVWWSARRAHPKKTARTDVRVWWGARRAHPIKCTPNPKGTRYEGANIEAPPKGAPNDNVCACTNNKQQLYEIQYSIGTKIPGTGKIVLKVPSKDRREGLGILLKTSVRGGGGTLL
jgi:hypothetical protein